MAIIEIGKIQHRSGNLVDLPQLSEAELGWATDAKLLFIGKATPNENVEVLTSYSNIAFSQVVGAIGNLNISNVTVADGQLLVYDGNSWVNRGGNAGGLITLGDVTDVKMDGGATGYVLETDGAGNLSWAPKATSVVYVQNVTNANPAVVTTVDDNFLADGMAVTFTNMQGMTDLNGNTYYANVLTANTFSLYTNSTLTTGLNSSAFNAYAYTSVTATTVTTNVITVGSSAAFTVNQPVKFLGDMANSGISNVSTYYVYSKPSGTQLKIATSADGNASNIVTLQTSTLTANVYQTGGKGVAVINSGSSPGTAGGSNTTIQYNNTGVLSGSSDLTFDFGVTPKLLTLNGNANVGNLSASGIVSSTRFISNIANGTPPIEVTSVTRVANLNVSYANVSDYGVVTTATTGTFYPVFVSGNTTGNYQIRSNANISFNSATSLLTVANLTVSGNTTIANLKDAGGNTVTRFDNDSTMAANSASYLPTQQATVSYVTSSLSTLVPTGSVLFFATNSAPAGYLVANGASYLRATYSNLSTLLGNTYGGNVTHFNVPTVTLGTLLPIIKT